MKDERACESNPPYSAGSTWPRRCSPFPDLFRTVCLRYASCLIFLRGIPFLMESFEQYNSFVCSNNFIRKGNPLQESQAGNLAQSRSLIVVCCSKPCASRQSASEPSRGSFDAPESISAALPRAGQIHINMSDSKTSLSDKFELP